MEETPSSYLDAIIPFHEILPTLLHRCISNQCNVYKARPVLQELRIFWKFSTLVPIIDTSWKITHRSYNCYWLTLFVRAEHWIDTRDSRIIIIFVYCTRDSFCTGWKVTFPDKIHTVRNPQHRIEFHFTGKYTRLSESRTPFWELGFVCPLYFRIFQNKFKFSLSFGRTQLGQEFERFRMITVVNFHRTERMFVGNGARASHNFSQI